MLHLSPWRKFEQSKCKAHASASRYTKIAASIHHHHISCNQPSGPPINPMRTSLGCPIPKQPRVERRGITVPRHAQCGNIKRGLEDCDGVQPPAASSSKRCPSRPKKIQTPGRPDRTASYHIMSWLFPAPQAPFPFLYPVGQGWPPKPTYSTKKDTGNNACCCSLLRLPCLPKGWPAHLEKPPEARKKMMGRGTGVVVMVVVQCKQLSLSRTPRSFQDDLGNSQPRYSSCGDDWRENAPDPVQRLANE